MPASNVVAVSSGWRRTRTLDVDEQNGRHRRDAGQGDRQPASRDESRPFVRTQKPLGIWRPFHFQYANSMNQPAPTTRGGKPRRLRTKYRPDKARSANADHGTHQSPPLCGRHAAKIPMMAYAKNRADLSYLCFSLADASRCLFLEKHQAPRVPSASTQDGRVGTHVTSMPRQRGRRQVLFAALSHAPLPGLTESR